MDDLFNSLADSLGASVDQIKVSIQSLSTTPGDRLLYAANASWQALLSMFNNFDQGIHS